MKFICCVKLTPDTEQLAEVRPEKVGSGDLGVTMVLNPWDEYAVEEALLLAERYDGESMVITMGDEASAEALKRAVAMGVGEAMLLDAPALRGSDAWGTAAALAAAIRQQSDYGLILTGKQSVDGNSGIVGPGVASKLGIPFVSNVIKIEEVSGNSATVRRMLDEGVQTVQVSLPAVVSVSIEINEPRYPSFMGIRKASRMQYPATGIGDLGLTADQVGEGAARIHWSDLRKPAQRGGQCEFIKGATVAEQAATLVDRLIADKVI
jgi:electron transfer flavoprotein beta subunit